jgi:hypothetical protein
VQDLSNNTIQHGILPEGTAVTSRRERARHTLEHTFRTTASEWLRDLCHKNLVRLMARDALDGEHLEGAKHRRAMRIF